MDKKEFKSIMQEFISLKEDTDNLHFALQKLDPDFGGLFLTRHEVLMCRILKNAMNDKGDWISYWIYELDCGKEAKPKSVSINGKNIPIKTIDNLYDLLTKHNDSN